jgi:hypothetical protein
MPPALPTRPRKIAVDVKEARTGNVAREIKLPPAIGISELPATVDELVAQAYQFPPGDGGSGTDDGWMT